MKKAQAKNNNKPKEPPQSVHLIRICLVGVGLTLVVWPLIAIHYSDTQHTIGRWLCANDCYSSATAAEHQAQFIIIGSTVIGWLTTLSGLISWRVALVKRAIMIVPIAAVLSLVTFSFFVFMSFKYYVF